jgi:hypothetical protein
MIVGLGGRMARQPIKNPVAEVHERFALGSVRVALKV